MWALYLDYKNDMTTWLSNDVVSNTCSWKQLLRSTLYLIIPNSSLRHFFYRATPYKWTPTNMATNSELKWWRLKHLYKELRRFYSDTACERRAIFQRKAMMRRLQPLPTTLSAKLHDLISLSWTQKAEKLSCWNSLVPLKMHKASKTLAHLYHASQSDKIYGSCVIARGWRIFAVFYSGHVPKICTQLF